MREKLESAKIRLTRNPGFNLIDGFRVFDTNGEGAISSYQIVEGLRSVMGIQVKQSDVRAFMNVFDKDGDGFLKYTEYCDAFLPLDNEQAATLASKPPIHQDENVDWTNSLSYEVKADFAQVWQTHFNICANLNL